MNYLARIHWSNLASIRFYLLVGFSTLLIGGGICLGLNAIGIPGVVQTVFLWIVAIGFALLYLTVGDALDCPQCGKNVKVGYSTCHHCGYTQSNAAPSRQMAAPAQNLQCEHCGQSVKALNGQWVHFFTEETECGWRAPEHVAVPSAS